MFCSTSVGVHLLRGLGAVFLFGVAWILGADAGNPAALRLIAAPLAIGGLVLLRGCPMCWLMGLFETIGKGKRNRV